MTDSHAICNLLFLRGATGRDVTPHDRAKLRQDLEARWRNARPDWDRALSDLAEIKASGEGFESRLTELLRGVDRSYQRLYAFYYALQLANRRDAAGITRFAARLLPDASKLSPIPEYVQVLDARFEYSRADLFGAEERLERLVSELDTTAGDPWVDFVLSSALQHLGYCQQSIGDFHAAERSYRESHCAAARHGFFARWYSRSALAELLWASGQPREALAIHTDSEARTEARENGRIEFLIRSHLSAGKCAIDLGSKHKAREELTSAQQLLEANEELRGPLDGFLRIYEGELALLEAKKPEAIRTLRDATLHFEALDPPYHPGALQAKVALCRVALQEGDHQNAFEIIEHLLREAEQTGCLDARARLLVLESTLFLEANPPLRAAYDNLVTRLALCNNPPLLLQALANLYVYSRESLDQSDQRELLERIRRVRPHLARSCRSTIYTKYLEEACGGTVPAAVREILAEITAEDGDREEVPG